MNSSGESRQREPNYLPQDGARVTVITPTYNRAELIKETIESVLAQDYEDYVYIILDDGSKDDTREVVEKMIEGRDNCFYLYHDNMGEANTVNKGWNLCKSEYFVQVNSDDTIEPTLLSEMVSTLDDNQDCVVAYSDFRIMNEQGETLEVINNMDWSFPRALADFACYAAAPGAFFRKSKLRDIDVFKDDRFKFTNDVKMLWNVALRGNFIHIPRQLASWRSHEVGISANRHESIWEIETWIEEYFNQDLPKEVRDIEEVCRSAIYNYYAQLMERSDLDYRDDMVNYYRERAKLPMARYVNLQVGDNDLIGNKFNGHDLHLKLRQRNIESTHLVWNKESDDNSTYIVAGNQINRQTIRSYNEAIQRTYDLDNIHNPLMYEIIYNKLFLDADIVHLHLMHNGLWDLSLLPMMSKLKPIVWTIHDTWILAGEPGIVDPPDYLFPLAHTKNHSLNWELKKEAIENSDITFVVASRYMEEVMSRHPVMKDKKMVYVPFGLNFDTFYPRKNTKTREDLGLKKTELLVLFRGDDPTTKGLQYVSYVMKTLGKKYKIHFLIVGSDKMDVPKGVKATYYGWIKDDEMMAKLYSVADLFLMPSTRESFGMMAVEAMACGTLPIVIEGTALPETVDAPVHGVSTSRDVEEYARTVAYYIENTKERNRRAKKCIQYVKNKHDMEKYLGSIDDLYREVISKYKRGAVYEKIAKDIKQLNEIKPSLHPVTRETVAGINNLHKIDMLFEATFIEKKNLIESNKILAGELADMRNSKRWQIVCTIADALPRKHHVIKLLRIGAVKRRIISAKDMFVKSVGKTKR